RYTEDKQRLFVAQAAEELSALPGVQSVSYADGVPLTIYGGSTRGGDLEFDGVRRHVERSVNWIGPDYFRTLGIPLLAGREFAARESGRPVIINQKFAGMFAGGNALGRTIRDEGKERLEVIGVVGDSKYRTLGENQRRAMYFPYNPRGGRVQFLVRGPVSAIPPVNVALRALDPSAAVESRSMRDGLAFALLPSRLGAAFLGSLGLLGLVLALVGLYGVIAYAVSRRTAEIGVRMALGATRASILRMTMKDGLLSAGAGLAIGLALAFVVTQPLSEFLVPGLKPADPLSFLGAALVLGTAAVLAGLPPARRAARIEPVSALRYE
ncbi:MAG: FtsX-like permease family protein, partial [Bryobacteraceae bacterium]